MVLEDDGAPAVREQVRGRRGLFEHGAARTEIAGQDDRAAFARERHRERTDDVVVVAHGGAHVVGDRPAVHRGRVAVQQRQELLQHDGQAARVEEVFHQVLARRADVREQRRRA